MIVPDHADRFNTRSQLDYGVSEVTWHNPVNEAQVTRNSGKVLLKPVLTVIPILSEAGQRIVGWVDPDLAASAVGVSAQASGSGFGSSTEAPWASAPASMGWWRR